VFKINVQNKTYNIFATKMGVVLWTGQFTFPTQYKFWFP
jgi:hypothetical protein